MNRVALPVHDLKKYKRIAVLTDGHSTPFLAKTAISLLRYRGEDVVAVIDHEHAGESTNDLFGVGCETPVVSSIEGLNPDAMFIGIAPPGGKLPSHWRPIVLDALSRGIDVVSGLHDFLCHNDDFVRAAKSKGAALIDVRKNDESEVATRAEFRRECVRIHAVGNDCSLGKMVTSLEIQKGLLQAGKDAGFAATGQTGIMVSGSGIPIDCVVSDFVNGATERLVLANQDHDYLLIEGQGSLSHPLYSGVTLGLLHGCAPDGLIFCYESGRKFVKGLEGIPLAPIRELFDAYETMANFRHPCRIIGVAANTQNLNEDEARSDMEQVEKQLGVPVCDVYRDGPTRLVAEAIKLREELVNP